ncbi:MAG: type II toxin-antitoxin system Phd/YefM family antitoxin [Hoeflea sp.]|uniref:type II toxin-antitoxin system Phd/YefM family antitoxin n=1 Tax=Hoeflea sp. TaxID=1940281 RepID=UPI001D476461|nr:type II toxin-antitoxin system Phd/YefM family antitoxin [Hoeflea sp.]MBU4527495.1 type II toxin-antitoxin system Phd/YefM family antitoxin [Alphaproteobacteria bacterium]MBU4543939.1 type II toxin-antitoxin system Phd/YefM family antitoxin [Alphaproteobacteria bacterium]MBU4552359.1 type II toxin-antitoxin system Phd/YefM family antitoxin [Alphaproteobacteria bacterium]MBV1725998.1 type II toxin-antitoxin system Phd/YefM family antitoxin [Hoeflea sp.]MBV1782356.1 type II toxin-antitoxin sy
MTITTVSSRDLNQDVSRAKKAARDGPVVITDRGKPSHVLMTYAEFERLTGQQHNLVDALSMPGLSEIEFAPSRVEIMPREIDLN